MKSKKKRGFLIRGFKEGGPVEVNLRTHLGTVKLGAKSLDVGSGIMSGLPIIEDLDTGRVWRIDWEELVDLAIECGVLDQEFPSEFDKSDGEG